MIDDFDFTKPQATAPAASAPFKASQSRFYKAEVAAALFKQVGREERFEPGQVVFAEDEKATKAGFFSRKATRMYYLAEGQVGLTAGGRALDYVKTGEVFGEMAVITGRPRSATANAREKCLTYSLDATELEAALARSPEFALMLASVMFDRVRFIAARLATRPRAAKGTPLPEAPRLDSKVVAVLQSELPRSALSRFPKETIIFKEGQAGTFLYVVKQGRVGIAVGSNLVETVGPGGTFGEMAVVDGSPRTARAGALEETELLAIDRATLLKTIGMDPAFAMALLRSVAERLRNMNAQLQGG